MYYVRDLISLRKTIHVLAICVVSNNVFVHTLSRRKLESRERLRNTISIKTLATTGTINWNRRGHPLLYRAMTLAARKHNCIKAPASVFCALCIYCWL